MRRSFAVLTFVLIQGVRAACGFAEEKAPETVAPGAKLIVVFADGRFTEGPTWDPKSGKLYFTAFGNKLQVMRLNEPGKASVWMDNSEGVNGTYLATDGRLIGAQGNTKKVISMEIGADGPKDVKTLFEDSTINNPNDLCQTPRGDIYFTSPDFAKREASAVYRIAPDGKSSKVIDDMAINNGIIASNDGRTLYVADSWEKLWRAYPINEDGTVGKGKVFFNPETENKSDPDGMSIDEHGNLYFTGRGGVWVVSPKGKSLGLIAVPEFCSNCTFGGNDGKTLYLTCAGKVYSLAMNARGGQFVK
jgi:gluconolactonase